MSRQSSPGPTSSRTRISPSHPHNHLAQIGSEADNVEVDFDDVHQDNVQINRKISVYKHIKKKAANDAQLLMYVDNFTLFVYYYLSCHPSMLSSHQFISSI